MTVNNVQTDLLAKVYSTILAWTEPTKDEKAVDRNKFSDLDQSAEDMTKPEGLTHSVDKHKGGNDATF